MHITKTRGKPIVYFFYSKKKEEENHRNRSPYRHIDLKIFHI